MSPDNLSPKFQFGTPEHQAFLTADAARQIALFRNSLRPGGGFFTLGLDGQPLDSDVQELHTTTRLVHSYAISKLAGATDCEAIIDQGMAYLWAAHRDGDNGGYLWAKDGEAVHDQRKLAYGHVFVLLAGSSALSVGHEDASRLIDDVTDVLETRFWEEDSGLFSDEYNADWSPFSTYRGMNANMHGVEALLAAYEATGRETYLNKAGRILDFFMRKMAPLHEWRLPEHYDDQWQVNPDYSENPMFRPAGTTPGHSFELARLMIQHWDLCGRPNDDTLHIARNVVYAALAGAWDAEKGGIFYTLGFDGAPLIRDRYWWPVTEAIGVLASLIKVDGGTTEDAQWYARLWAFADATFIDDAVGGWMPEINADNQPVQNQFVGKPDIYHALQADLLPLTSGVSGYYKTLSGIGL